MGKRVTDSGSGRAVQLVYGDENGQLKIDLEAIEALQQLKGPIAIVSLYGGDRHFKNFIWNQLLGASMGFQVGPVHRSCVGGLWMWIAPVKRIAEDETEYNLVLLDVSVASSDDQWDTCRTKIFSLTFLLSSMFICGQMDGVNDVLVDNLSLLTEITKREDVGAAADETVFGLGHLAPILVWLLTDNDPEMVEGDSKLRLSHDPESAVMPAQFSGQDIAANNEIHESFHTLFPNQEFIALGRPLINEIKLQHLDQIPREMLHPQFRSRIDALAKFVFERTRPKQIGGTIMTGPLLTGFTKSFIENLNNGVVPTISSTWQSIEELENRRAYDLATEAYACGLKRMEAAEEALLVEAHNKAVLKAMTAFDRSAVGTSAARQKYETRLQNFLRKAFEDCKQVAYTEADSRCCHAIENMGKRLQTVSRSHDVDVNDVIKALDTLVAEYEVSVHGPRKWQKLSSFLKGSLQDILVHRSQKRMAELLSENSNLVLQQSSMQDTIDWLKKQLEGGEKLKNEYQKLYKDAIDDIRKLSDQYKCRIRDLESKCRSVEDKYSHLMETLEPTRLDAFEWKRKCEEILAILESKGGIPDQSIDWKIKYENAVKEAKATSEKVMAMEESLKQACAREEDRKVEFSRILDDKEERISEKAAKLANAEKELSALSLELKNVKSNMEKCHLESADLKLQIRVLDEKYHSVKSAAESFDTEAESLRQGKNELEEKYLSYVEKFENVCSRLKVAESEAAMAKELDNSMRAEADAVRNKENELQKLLTEKCMDVDRAKSCIENLEKQKAELEGKVESCCLDKQAVECKVALLEARLKEKEEEIMILKRINGTQKENTIETYVNSRQEDSYAISGEVAEDPNSQTPHGKRSRLEAEISGSESSLEMDAHEDTVTPERKKFKNLTAPSQCTTEVKSSLGVSHTKYTMKMLRKEIIKHGFGSELLQLKSPRKKDLLDLYERRVLRK